MIEKWKGSITAAIAYVGSTGDVQLPLSQGCSLIVDASEHAVAGHMTNPHTLLRCHRAGVSLYSRPHLHAKMILAESLGGAAPFLVVGSANASQHSANVLEEAALVTDSIELIGQAREALTIWKATSTKLGAEALARLCAIYDDSTDAGASEDETHGSEEARRGVGGCAAVRRRCPCDPHLHDDNVGKTQPPVRVVDAGIVPQPMGQPRIHDALLLPASVDI
ncbi:hypothetical protein [Gordonia sp. NPDC003376]